MSNHGFLRSEPLDANMTSSMGQPGFRRVLWPSILALSVQFAQILLGLISVPVLLHALGSEQYSAFAILWALPALAPLIDLGMPRAIASLLVHGRSDGSNEQGHLLIAAALVQVAVLVIAAVLAGALLATAPPTLHGDALMHLTGDAVLGHSIVGKFLLASALLSLVNIVAAFFQARGDLNLLLVITALSSLTVSAVPLTALFTPPTLSELGTYTVYARSLSLLLALMLIVFKARAYQWRASYGEISISIKKLLRSGSRALTYFAVSPLLVFGERYLVPVVGGSLGIAPHLIAVDLGLRFLIVPGVIGQYSFRAIADAAGTRNQHEAAAHGYMRVMTWLFVLPVLGAICFSQELLRLWLGAARLELVSVPCVQIVLIAITTCAVSSFLVQASLISNAMHRLSSLVALELVLYPPLVLLVLYLRPSSFSLSIVLSVLWSVRVLMEAMAMIRLTRDMFATQFLTRVSLVFVGLPALGALLVNVVDHLSASSSAFFKALVFISLSTMLVRLSGHSRTLES